MRIAVGVISYAFISISQALSDQPLQDKFDTAHTILADVRATPESIHEAREAMQSIVDQTSRSNPYLYRKARLALAADMMLNRQNLPAALPMYQNLRQILTPGTQEWKEATLGLAIVQQHRIPVSPQSIASAQSLYQELADLDSDHPIVARAIFNLARIYEMVDFEGDRPNFPAARQCYRNILERWPDEDIAHEAALRLGGNYQQEAYYPPNDRLADWEWRVERIQTGIGILEEWARRYPDHPLNPGFWEYIANCYLFKPDPENWLWHALNAYLHATGGEAMLEGGEPPARTIGMDKVDGGYLMLRIAALAQRLGEREIALEYYTRLITQIPEYSRGPEAALQLTANLGFSRDEVLERARRQLMGLGYRDYEINRILDDFEFLDHPPEGIAVPQP